MALLFEEVGMNGMNATDKIPAFKVFWSHKTVQMTFKRTGYTFEH